MFDDIGRPRVYAVPVGCDFTRSFVDGLLWRLGTGSPEDLAKVVIYTGSVNSALELRQSLESGPAMLLPRIRPATALVDDVSLPMDALPPPMTTVGAMLAMRRLIGALLEQEPDLAPGTAAIDLADSLLGVFSELQDEGIDLGRLLEVDVDDQSGHWERSLHFLGILAGVFGDDGMLDRRSRFRAAVNAKVDAWSKQPPDHPVIIAGSTGFTAPMMHLMRAVAGLRQGAVVLPGVDRELCAEDWALLEKHDECPEHPQSVLARFCRFADVSPPDLPDWSDTQPANPRRNRLISLALRPAPFTDRWMEESPGLVPELDVATNRIGLILAATMKEEAQAIAVAIREAVEARKRVALVTQNLELAKRVKAALKSWEIEPDDRIGESLRLTGEGVFLRLALELFDPPLAPHILMSVLKHPLTNAGERGNHVSLTASLERALRQRPAPVVDHRSIELWAEDGGDRERQWAEWLAGVLRFAAELRSGTLDDLIGRHVYVANALASGSSPVTALPGTDEEPAGPLWETRAGQDLSTVLSRLANEADVAGTMDVAEYRGVFRKLTIESNPYEQAINQKDVVIWGGYQVRDRIMDLVILGSLNEGVWPPARRGDVWLNRAMRRQIGLGLPERQNGLAAHDFQQAVAAPEIVLSRSLRDGEQPTVASRWLIRFQNLVTGMGPAGEAAIKAMTDRGERLIRLGCRLGQPDRPESPEPRPEPVPPVGMRPTKLSVTEIRTLIQNPYAIYARHVLRLRPLDHLGRDLDARERGAVFHRIMETFVGDLADGRVTPEAGSFLKCAERILEDEVASPSLRMSWYARLHRIAEWLMIEEAKRREGAETLGLEVAGKWKIPDFDFTLTARADRVDRGEDGQLRIFDYKSGPTPTRRAIEDYDKQLQLAGAMAARGGFEGIPAAGIAWLQYIGMGATRKTENVETEDGLLTDTWTGLVELLLAYTDPGLGYPARSRMTERDYGSDYDHLSRYGEWSEVDTPVKIGLAQ